MSELLRCWSCFKSMTEAERLDADGHCPHCGCEYCEDLDEDEEE